ncbi:MAG: O-antigen ligase family protein [Bacteroidia bacterium]|nr:O-antigen ligase family protein [Bacteroidia bacterium]
MRTSLTPVNVSFFLLLAMVAGLTASKAILSVGMIALLATGVWNWRLSGTSFFLNPYKTTVAGLLIGLFFIAVLCGFYTENTSGWLRDVKTKLSIVLIPLALLLLSPLRGRQKYILSLVFIFIQTLWAIITLGKFWKNHAEEMEKVRQNSNIDIFGSISHIYFGLLLAFACILGLYLLFRKNTYLNKPLLYLLLFATLINLISLHILSSRTAQVSFYLSLWVWIVVEIWIHRRWKESLAVFLILMLLPVLAYYTIPSFRMRIEVSVWDYNMYQNQAGIYKDNSISSRLLAWGEAWAIFKENPLFGIGIEDVGPEIERRLIQKGMYQTVPEHLKIPHNLYLKYLSGVGIVGFFYLLLVIFFPLKNAFRQKNTLLVAFIALTATAFFFENFPERQIGIVFFCLGYLLIPDFE